MEEDRRKVVVVVVVIHRESKAPFGDAPTLSGTPLVRPPSPSFSFLRGGAPSTLRATNLVATTSLPPFLPRVVGGCLQCPFRATSRHKLPYKLQSFGSFTSFPPPPPPFYIRTCGLPFAAPYPWASTSDRPHAKCSLTTFGVQSHTIPHPHPRTGLQVEQVLERVKALFNTRA